MMTLDERVRVGLRRSADTGPLDTDDAFDSVRESYDRGVVRARVLRQATTVAVVVTLLAGVGTLISWRAAPDRYRTTATVAVTQSAAPEKRLATVGLHPKAADPRLVALAAPTRAATLRAANAPSDDSRIHFRAVRTAPNRLSLEVAAPTTTQSAALMRQWVRILARTRDDKAREPIRAAITANNEKLKKLFKELRRVDEQLVKSMPIVYHGVLAYDFDDRHSGRHQPPPPPVPEQGSVHQLNLAFQRIQLRGEISKAAERAAQLRFAQVESDTSTRVVGRTPTVRITKTPPATWAALAGWVVALLLVIAGGFVIYRRRRTFRS